MRAKIQRLLDVNLKGDFFKNTSTLVLGSIAAQSIAILISPLLTRIYGPADFGVFALYSSCLQILAVLATGKIELSILFPDSERDATDNFFVSVFVTATFSFLLLVAILLFSGPIVTHLLDKTPSHTWLYVLPFSVFFSGFYQCLSYWRNREKKFMELAKNRIIVTSSNSATSLALGLNSFLHIGLTLGSLVGLASGCFMFLRESSKQLGSYLNKAELSRLYSQRKKYFGYYKFSVIGNAFEALTLELPVLILTQSFSPSAVGQYGLFMRILNIPAVFLSSAFSQVFINRISSHARSPETLRFYVAKALSLLIVAITPFVAIIAFGGEEIFTFIFGSPWREAGMYASIFIYGTAARFIAGSLRGIFALEKNIHVGTIWQVIYTFTSAAALLFAARFDLRTFFIIYTIHEVILYSIYLFLIFRSIKQVRIGFS